MRKLISHSEILNLFGWFVLDRWFRGTLCTFFTPSMSEIIIYYVAQAENFPLMGTCVLTVCIVDIWTGDNCKYFFIFW